MCLSVSLGLHFAQLLLDRELLVEFGVCLGHARDWLGIDSLRVFVKSASLFIRAKTSLVLVVLEPLVLLARRLYHSVYLRLVLTALLVAQ